MENSTLLASTPRQCLTLIIPPLHFNFNFSQKEFLRGKNEGVKKEDETICAMCSFFCWVGVVKKNVKESRFVFLVVFVLV